MKDSRSADVNFLSCGSGQKRDTREQRESEPARKFGHPHKSSALRRSPCNATSRLPIVSGISGGLVSLAATALHDHRPPKSGESSQKGERIRGRAHREMDRRRRSSTLKHLQHASAALLVPSGSSLIDARRPSSESGAGKAGPVWIF